MNICQGRIGEGHLFGGGVDITISLKEAKLATRALSFDRIR